MARLRIWHLVPLAVLAVTAGLPAAAAPAAAAAKTYTITNLGSLGFAGYDTTEATAINAGGQVAGYSDTATTITFPCPGHYRPPRTCSSQTKTAGVTHAALWTGTTMVDLGALAPLSSGSWSDASGINDSGQVVGSWASSQSTSGTGSHPWVYSNGTMTSLPEPSGFTSCAADAINNNSQIIGSCRDASGTEHAVLWQNGTVTVLGTLGGLQVTMVTAINNLGQIAGWGTTSTGAIDGFLDSNGTVTDLGTGFRPFALNDNGVMVDGTGQIDSGGTVQNLNNLIPANSGYTIGFANAINDNGQIAAQANGSAVLLNPN